MDETLLLRGADVEALLPLGDCITAIEDAFRSLGSGTAAPPAALGMAGVSGSFHVKAGVLARGGRSYFAAKVNGNFPLNPEWARLPTIQGVLVLCDAADGRVLAVMDSRALTALRTAAATAVAARQLARRDAAAVAICGCGVQGRMHLRALAEVLPVRRAHVYDLDAAQAHTLVEEMSGALDIAITVERDIAAAVGAADVCVTCTTSTAFLLHADMVRPGQFIAGVGVDNAGKRELAPDVLVRADKLVTDLFEQCARLGDLQHALAAGAVSPQAVHGDLGDIVAGRRSGRERPDEVIVFDSTGLALQDVAAAAVIHERAAAGHAAGVCRIAFA